MKLIKASEGKQNKKEMQKRMTDIASQKMLAIQAENINIVKKLELKNRIYGYYNDVLDQMTRGEKIDRGKLDTVNSIMRELK